MRTRTVLAFSAAYLMIVALVAIGLWQLINPSGFDERLRVATMIGTGATAFVLLGNLFVSSMTVAHSQETLLLQQSSDLSDRFFRATEQLSQSEYSRIGALYSLERLSQESPEYYDQVIEVICSFVREYSREHPPPPVSPGPLPSNYWPKAPHPIEVAMSILARRAKRLGAGETRRLDLRGANLCGLRFFHADFQRAIFDDAVCIDTVFWDCNLAHTSFLQADLRRAIFRATVLVNASTLGAKAQGGHFYYGWQLPDPSDKIVVYEETDEGEVWRRPKPKKRPSLVDGERYLDGVKWFDVELEQATFSVQNIARIGLTDQQRTQIAYIDESV